MQRLSDTASAALQPTLGNEITSFTDSSYQYALEMRLALNVRAGVSDVALGTAVYTALTSSLFQASPADLPAIPPLCLHSALSICCLLKVYLSLTCSLPLLKVVQVDRPP